MSSWQAKLNLETGNWHEANRIAQNLLQNEGLPATSKLNALVVAATISLRRGDEDALPALNDLKNKAFETREHQRIIPAMTAFLEYEWIYGKQIFSEQQLEAAINIAEATDNMMQNSEFYFWLNKVKAHQLNIPELFEGYDFSSTNAINKAVSIWRSVGCPYEEALALSSGNAENKKQAIVMMQQLGANAVYKKIKQIMMQSGVKNIPRGMQPATKANPSFLTNRELDILRLLQEGLQNKEIASRLFISAKTVDHHISSLFFKLGVNTRVKAVQVAIRLEILK
jgi:DNA-binding CsgD family transcriptional regulator